MLKFQSFKFVILTQMAPRYLLALADGTVGLGWVGISTCHATWSTHLYINFLPLFHMLTSNTCRDSVYPSNHKVSYNLYNNSISPTYTFFENNSIVFEATPLKLRHCILLERVHLFV